MNKLGFFILFLSLLLSDYLFKKRLNKDNKQQNYFPQTIFSQQKDVGNRIIDGHIEVKSSKFLIETKLNQKEFIDKLVKYRNTFNENSQNQLWYLSSEKFDDNEVIHINQELSRIYPKLNIQFNNLLFNDLIDNLKGIYS